MENFNLRQWIRCQTPRTTDRPYIIVASEHFRIKKQPYVMKRFLKKCQVQRYFFLVMSVCNNVSKFEYRPIRRQYFDIYIHFEFLRTYLHDKKKTLLNLALLYNNTFNVSCTSDKFTGLITLLLSLMKMAILLHI